MAGQVERIAEGVTQRAVTAVEQRRGGSFLAAVLLQVHAGIVYMLRDWRLMLLQVPAVVAVGYTLYRLRVQALGVQELAEATIGRFLVGVVLAVPIGMVVYACSTVFTFALLDADASGGIADLGQAWHRTRRRLRLIVAWSLLTALVVVGLFFFARGLGRVGYTLVGGIAAGVLVMLLSFVPMAVAAARPKRKRRLTKALAKGQATFMATISSASAVLAAVTVGLMELGRLMIRVLGFRVIGTVAAIIGALLHAATSSSVRALKFTTKLRPDEPDPPAEPATR